MREKLEIMTVYWIFDLNFGGKCFQCPSMESRSSVDFGMLLIQESVINYRTYSIVSSFPTMKFSSIFLKIGFSVESCSTLHRG